MNRFKRKKHGKKNNKRIFSDRSYRKKPNYNREKRRGASLFMMVVASVLVFTIAGLGIEIEHGQVTMPGLKEPLFAQVIYAFEGAEDGDDDLDFDQSGDSEQAETAQVEVANSQEADSEADSKASETQAKGATDEKAGNASAEKAGEAAGEKANKPAKQSCVRYKKIPKTKVKSPYYSDPGKVALDTKYDYKKVEKSYFDDAVFLGDSRIVGLKDYGNLKKSAFFCEEGLSIYKLFGAKCAKGADGKKTTVRKALEERKFGKVYIMIGINELGKGTTSDFKAEYRKKIRTIRKLQPDAKIFIMGIMGVSKKQNESSDVFNNVNINDKNVAIASLADGENVFYIDMNPKFSTKERNIKSKLTWDGIHLKAEYYADWVDFLKTRGV